MGCSGRCSRGPRPTGRRTSDATRASGAVGRARIPNMRSFLGIPIVSRGDVIGAFYLTDKEGARRVRRRGPAPDRDARRARRDRDRERAPLRAQPRALDRRGAEPARPRPTRLRHAEALRRRPHRRGGRRRCSSATRPVRVGSSSGCGTLAKEAMEELRSVVFELRPAALEAEGLAMTLRKHVEVVRRVHEREIDLRVDGAPPPDPEGRRRGAADRAGGALERAAPFRRHGVRGRARGAGRRAGAGRERRRRRLRPRRPVAPLPPARAHLDGGARAGDRQASCRSISAPGSGTTIRLEVRL